MLSNNTIKQLLALITEQEQLLESYSQLSPLYHVEARFTLFEIKNLLINHKSTLSTKLVKMLAERWERIQDTNCQYLHDFTSPANTVCILIASILSKTLTKNNLCLLMPSLKKVPSDQYLTSSYTDDDISMRDIILSDSNQRIINVPDVLDSAQEDGILKHNSLINGRVRKLSLSERTRLHSRHPSVTTAFNALTARISYKYDGDTVGAALNRLIIGLTTGGVHELNGDEYEADEFNATEHNAGTDANLAILTFGEYLETLDPETKSKLLSTGKTDRYASGFVEEITIAQSWTRLSAPEKQQDKLMAEQYCVKLIAGDLREILDANPELYNLVSYQGQALGNLVKLNEDVVDATKKMKEHLSVLQTHYCYDKNDPALAKNLLHEIRKSRLPLTVKEFQLFIQMHLSASNDSILTRQIDQVFKNNFYSKNEYKKLSTEEQEHYFKLNTDHKKTSVASHPATLFQTHKRKNRSSTDENNPECTKDRPEKINRNHR